MTRIALAVLKSIATAAMVLLLSLSIVSIILASSAALYRLWEIDVWPSGILISVALFMLGLSIAFFPNEFKDAKDRAWRKKFHGTVIIAVLLLLAAPAWAGEEDT